MLRYREFAVIMSLAGSCCSVYGQNLSVDVSVATMAEPGGRIRYEYLIENSPDSELTINAFVLDVETGADIQDLQHPEGWFGEYLAEEDPFELAWIALDTPFEIAIGGSGTFSFTSPLEPGPIPTFIANLTVTGEVVASIVEDFEGPAILPPPVGIPGDYNNSGLVEQGDLDLVLGNWGAEAANVPASWINDPPLGIVDQAELDGVLGNWGSTQAGGASAAVPEPATCLLLMACAVLLVAQRTAGRRDAD